MPTLHPFRQWLPAMLLLTACAGPHAAEGNVVPQLRQNQQMPSSRQNQPDSLPGIVDVTGVPDSPYGIASDLTGNEWIAGQTPAMLVSLDEASHAKALYKFSEHSRNPDWVALGPNHKGMWFNEPGYDRIGFIRLSTHQIRRFAVTSGAVPTDIAAGPDNGMWFTEQEHSKIGRIGMANYQITEYSVPGNVDPYGITLGPDGSMWFTEYNANKIGRITMNHQVTQYPLPHAMSDPFKITSGPDNAVWFTEFATGHGRIGRIDPATGNISEWDVPSTSETADIVARDNELWFTEPASNKIGRIDSASHAITEYAVPANSEPWGIALGKDNQLWFTERESHRIGKLCPAKNSQQCATSN